MIIEIMINNKVYKVVCVYFSALCFVSELNKNKELSDSKYQEAFFVPFLNSLETYSGETQVSK
jgi:hypothetical protein